MNHSILIVDSDKRANELLQNLFTIEGYNVIPAYNGTEAISILEKNADIILIILDILLPDSIDGWHILEYVKTNFDVKIIILTSLSDEFNEAKGLRNGADDYIIKPYKKTVLIERAKRLINLAVNDINTDFICGKIRVSQNERKVFIDDIEIKMTLKEYQLLQLLMSNSPNVLDRETILYKIWGYEYEGNDRTIDSHIKMLRQSLKEYGDHIRTIRGIGYSFEGKVYKLNGKYSVYNFTKDTF